MATAPIYCTHKELKRVYPQISSFDNKIPIYGWQEGINGFYDTSIDIYYAHNSGLVTQLYFDGAKIDSITYNTTETTKLDGVLSDEATSFDVDGSHGLEENDIIKIDNEYLRIVSVSSNTITVSSPATNRGLFDTVSSSHANDASVYKIIDVNVDLGDATSAGQDALAFVYDSDLDMCLLVGDSDPNDHLMEAGEAFTAMITQIRTDASRYLDSKLDPNLPREQLKDKSGNFDYMIIRSTALIAAAFLIRANDPTNEIATALMEEAQGNIDALNDGKAALSWQTTRDASRGIIRDVSYTNGSVRPVDTRGMYSGTFDLVRVKIETGGALDGTATYSVWVKNGDKLGNQQGNQVVTSEKINGDYQALTGGLEIRFAGEDKTSVATATNEWEIEVMGASEHIDASGVKSVSNTRWLLR